MIADSADSKINAMAAADFSPYVTTTVAFNVNAFNGLINLSTGVRAISSFDSHYSMDGDQKSDAKLIEPAKSAEMVISADAADSPEQAVSTDLSPPSPPKKSKCSDNLFLDRNYTFVLEIFSVGFSRRLLELTVPIADHICAALDG